MPQAREFAIIERFFARAPTDASVTLGIGDDAAVVDTAGPIAVAVDTLVAGTHFPDSLEARAVGHRALAVNLSDLAAVGANPRWATLALTLPVADEDWIAEFAGGFFDLAERYGVSLIGGDTTRGPLSVTVQVIGDQNHAPLRRSGGEAGDLVFVSGSLGAGAAALDCLGRDPAALSQEASVLINRFKFPEPRVELGLALIGLAHAAIDVSDGLVADLGHLCAQSGCGALLNLNNLPISDALRAQYPRDAREQLALHGGDDYELCFSVAPGDAGRVTAAALAVGVPVTAIGELTKSGEIRGRRNGDEVSLEAQGFVHFQ